MSKGKGDKQRSSREAKKPKKVKEKVPETASFAKGISPSSGSGKKK